MRFKLRNLSGSHAISNNDTLNSGAKLLELIRYAGDSIFIIDSSYQITEVNDSGCKLLNYSREELCRMKMYQLMSLEDKPLFMATSEVLEKEGGSIHERRFKRKDGSIIHTEVNVRLIEGLGYISIVRDISERKMAEARIIERESQLTAFFENIEGASALLDAEKKYVLFNNRFILDHRLLTNTDPYVGQEVYDLFPEEIRKSRLKLLDNVLKGNKEVVEVEYVRNGKRVCYRSSFNAVITNGKVTGISTYSIDLTKSKEADSRIKEREALLTALFDNIESSLSLYDVNKKLVLFNGRFADNYKLLTNHEAKVGDGAHDFLSEEMKSEPAKLMDNALKGNKEVFEKDYLVNGRVSRFRSSFNPVINEGKVTGVTSFTVDLTKNREAQIKIRESEEKFRMSFMTGQDAFYIGTLHEGRIIDVNQSFYDLFGYTRQELIGKTSKELTLYIYPEERAKMVEELETRGSIKDLEMTCRKKNGELMLVSLSVNVWEMNNEPVIMAVIRDITEKKRIEKELIESEVRFREVLENALSASFKRNLLTNSYEYLSPVFKKITGFTQEDMNSLPLETVIGLMHPDDIQSVKDGIAKGINNPSGAANSIEYRFKHKTDGGYRWLQDDFVVMHNELGQPISFIGSVTDITGRKQIATELLESKEQMALFIEYSPASLAMFDNEMRYIATSRRWRNDYKLGDQNIIGKTHYEVFPTIPERWKAIHQRCLQGAVEKNDEDHFFAEDGTEIWNKWEIRPWKKASGDIGGIIMFTEVITEKKLAEAALQKSNQQYSQLFNNMLSGLMVCDVIFDEKGEPADHRFVQGNPAFEKLTGLSLKDQIGRTSKDFAIGWPPEVVKKLYQVAITEEPIQYERYNETLNKYYETRVFSPRKGSFAHVFTDVTERKKAEAAVKEQAETFSAIIENATESIWLLSPDLKVLQFNKTAKNRILLHRGKEVYTGANFKEFLYPGTENIFMPMFNDALAGQYPERESYQTSINGEPFWLRTRMYPVHDKQKRLIGVTVLSENVTERKKAEDELRESEEKFRSFVEETLVGVFILQDEKIVYANPGFEKISGYSQNELISGMKFQQLIYEGDVDWVKGNYELRISGEKPSDEYLLRALKKDGTIIYVDVIVSRIIYNHKPAVIGSVIDRTDIVEEEKRIGRAVTDAQEKERTQIGMELHDNVKQIMAASLMNLDFAKKNIDDKKVSIEIIDDVRGYIHDAINELRRLSHQLAPAVDDGKGTLVEKIEKLVNDSKIADKMEVFLDIEELTKPIEPEIQLAFYRIMQEQFNNILKYSKATGVIIRVKRKEGKLILSIKDDGVGFDTTIKKDGIGIENIKRRINTLNGDAQIISSPGEGCEVRASVPLT